MTPPTHEILIIGAGPTGLMLAGELALAGADVAIVERRLDQQVEGSRAGGLHPRAIELLDQRGIADRFIEQGSKHYAVAFAGAILDAADRPTRHNYTLGLWQAKIEQGLADWVAGFGVPIYRGRDLAGFTEHAAHVTATLDGGHTLTACYLVGCDGGRSLVRKTAGIAFPGWEPSLSYLIYEADMPGDPPIGMRHGERGVHGLGRLEAGGAERVRGVVTEHRLIRDETPTEDQLRAALTAAYGSDCGVTNISWLSRFTDAARQAAEYRKGRILLAGDAAHVHSPVGGQGLNIGLQDAVNLGWKLAQVVKGISPDTLLDTYHSERHPAGAALLQQTLALTALNRGDDRSNALRAMMAKVMQMDEPRRWYTAMMSGLDVRYDMAEGEGAHPLVGRRVPDLDIVTAEGPTGVFALLREGRWVLLNFGEAGAFGGEEAGGRLKVVDAVFDGACELPVIGVVPMPSAVMIRPDGHVAWVGEGASDGLHHARKSWFGKGGSVG